MDRVPEWESSSWRLEFWALASEWANTDDGDVIVECADAMDALLWLLASSAPTPS